MEKSVQLAALRRQVAPPAFTDDRAPMNWSVQLAALERQVAPLALTDYGASE